MTTATMCLLLIVLSGLAFLAVIGVRNAFDKRTESNSRINVELLRFLEQYKKTHPDIKGKFPRNKNNKDIRSGITLMEVLIAIFILGVGLLAILTLFPLGATKMRQAVRDDRVAYVAANADSLAKALGLRDDPALKGVKYPVLVDPYYAQLLGSAEIGKVPGLTNGLSRVAPSYATNNRSIARFFSFQDDLAFDSVGRATVEPPKSPPTSVRRPGTYTWAYLLRRNGQVPLATVSLEVVVYANRAHDVVAGETTFHNNGTTLGVAGTRTLDVSFVGTKPNVRRGSWMLDTSHIPNTDQVAGRFYEVASVEDMTQGSMRLGLETPLLNDVTVAVLTENVIAVVDRGVR